jgi:hypothetical protein
LTGSSKAGPEPNRRKRNSGRIDLPVRAADRVRFDTSFGKRFMVFVDTEEEFDWKAPRSRESVSTNTIRHLTEFQDLMDAHGVSPAYMIDYPVVNNGHSAEVIARLAQGGRCTIGTQLHPWVNPPHDEEVNILNSFVGNLPKELEQEKLHVLTDKIESVAGYRPIIYRAGRYGIGPNSGDLLEAAGYRIDTSVRPFFDYSHEGGPNFLKHDSRPYWTGPNGMLLELPLGATFTGQLRRYGRLLFGNGRDNAKRIAAMARSGMLERVALTPEGWPLDDVIRAIDWMLRDGQKLLSFSFHSPSLAPGHTPYVRNSADLMKFYGWWDKVLAHLERKGVKPASVDETLQAAWSTRQS